MEGGCTQLSELMTVKIRHLMTAENRRLYWEAPLLDAIASLCSVRLSTKVDFFTWNVQNLTIWACSTSNFELREKKGKNSLRRRIMAYNLFSNSNLPCVLDFWWKWGCKSISLTNVPKLVCKRGSDTKTWFQGLISFLAKKWAN